MAELDPQFFRELMNERNARYEDRFKAMDEKTSLALAASEKAVTKAEAATEKRFDSVNEFRKTLSDQAATFLARPEAEAKFKGYDEKLDDVKKEIAGLRESRSEIGGGTAVARWSFEKVLAMGALVIALISLYFRSR